MGNRFIFNVCNGVLYVLAKVRKNGQNTKEKTTFFFGVFTLQPHGLKTLQPQLLYPAKPFM